MARLDYLHGTARVLDDHVVASLGDYQRTGGGSALEDALAVDTDLIVDMVRDAGLRGRGGGGFPTWLKWSAVAESESPKESTAVVVNAAEGEPGTFKDRDILRRNPYRLLEGAAIAARAVDAGVIRIGIKASFVREIRRLDRAITETMAAGWFDGIDIALVLGAGYLFGEETAMLEVVEGRQPFPRVAPPFRRGVDDGDLNRNASRQEMAEVGGSGEPPALVNNVETLSNVPLIVANGVDWFRELGTEKSPGTITVTVSGDTNRAGVAEVPMGTTLGEAIELIGWGVKGGRDVGVIISGTANPMMSAEALNLPLTYEDMSAAGFGLGSAGFVVFDDRIDPAAVAQGVSHFLAVESCGQCEACKLDGTELSILLAKLSASDASSDDINEIRRRQRTVSVGARCNLARQQEAVVGSLLTGFPTYVEGHHKAGVNAPLPPAPQTPLIAPIDDIVGGTVIVDSSQASKQLDWSYGDSDSGTVPAARFGNTPFVIAEPTPHPHEKHWPAEIGIDRIHPLEEIDSVHDRIDQTLAGIIHGDSSQCSRCIDDLVHLVGVHMDVSARILYPTVRRHCGEHGDVLADRATACDDQLGAAVKGLGSLVDDHDALAGQVQQISELLGSHIDLGHQMFDLLAPHLDQQEKKVLLDALTEADATSQVS